jgi:ADP-heptose:LPS heptosyltransferase
MPAGRSLDRQLTDFGITSFEQLYQRAISTHTRQYRYSSDSAPRLIVLLSRVTIGADVAILSVIIQRLKHLFPEADMLVVGNGKLRGLFGGNPEIRIRELTYPRRGGLFERFSSWHATLKIIREEAADLREDEMLLIDPDSRISQLGVLPLTNKDHYLFLNTRDHVLSASGKCVAEWTDDWMNAAFGEADFCYPRIWVPASIMKTAEAKINALRTSGARRIIAVNFGVGQNPRKRVGPEFEKRLLRTLIAIPGTVVILDRGFGADEVYHSALLAAHARECGFASAETRFSETGFPSFSHGLVSVECSIGEMAALISHSDEYIGYDSACQHIAAAARTPTLTIFAGSNNKNFVRRWSACGETDCQIVHVNTLSDPQHLALDEVISRIMQERTGRTGSPPRRYQETRPRRRARPAEERSIT